MSETHTGHTSPCNVVDEQARRGLELPRCLNIAVRAAESRKP